MRRYVLTGILISYLIMSGLIEPCIAQDADDTKNNIIWECDNGGTWREDAKYQLGVLMHHGAQHSIRTDPWGRIYGRGNKPFDESVGISLVPYIYSSGENIKYFFVPTKDKKPESRRYRLHCSPERNDNDVMQTYSPDLYPSVLLSPPNADSLTLDQKAEWQKDMKNFLTKSVATYEIISPFDLNGSSISTMSQLLKSVSQRMGNRMPFLDGWQHGDILIDKFVGEAISEFPYAPDKSPGYSTTIIFPATVKLKSPLPSCCEYYTSEAITCTRQNEDEDLNFDYTKNGVSGTILLEAKELNSYRDRDLELLPERFSQQVHKGVMTDSKELTNSAERVSVQINLPEIFQKIPNVELSIQGCDPPKPMAEGSLIYQTVCTDNADLGTFAIQGFKVENIEQQIISQNKIIELKSQHIKKSMSLSLPADARVAYSLATEKIPPGDKKIFTVSMDSSFPIKMTLQAQGMPDCDFQQSITLDQVLKDDPIVLTPSCYDKMIVFPSGTPKPSRASGCLSQDFEAFEEENKLTCFRKKEADVQIFWSDEQGIKPVNISARDLDSRQGEPYYVQPLARTTIRLKVVLPGVFKASEDLSAELSFDVNGCRALKRTEEKNSYTTICERSPLPTTLRINKLSVDIPLRQTAQAANSVTVQADIDDITFPVSVQLESNPISGTDLQYQLTDNQGKSHSVEAGSPLSLRIPFRRLFLNPLIFQPQNRAYAQKCNIQGNFNLQKVLEGSLNSFPSPCMKNALTWTEGLPQPEFIGCLGTENSTAGMVECVRQKGENITARWADGASIELTAEQLDNSHTYHIERKFPVVIETMEVPYDATAKFFLFSTEQECETIDTQTMTENVTLYTAATMNTLQAKVSDWAVVAKGGKRISTCARGEKEGNRLVYRLQSNMFTGKRLVVAIENSRYLGQPGSGRGTAIQEGLVDWLSELQGSGSAVPLTLLLIQGSGTVKEILRGEDLKRIVVKSQDPDIPSIYATVFSNVDFHDEGFQPLKHLDTIAQLLTADQLRSVLYFSDSRAVPDPMSGSQIGTLFDWRDEGVRVKIVTNNVCNKWNYKGKELVLCEQLPDNPTPSHIKDLLKRWRADNQ